MEVMEVQEQNNKVVSVGSWIGTLILLVIPIINFVFLFIWALSSDTPVSKKNFAKATLILSAIGFFLGIILFTLIGLLIPEDAFTQGILYFL